VMCKRIEGWMERALDLTLGSAVHPVIREEAHLAAESSGRCRTFCRYVAEWGS